MPKIKINDINLYYESYGQGQPLVFVGGFCADHFAWMSIVRLFAENYRVIIFDNRGSGQSDCPNYPYTIEMLTADVAGLCDQLQIHQAHFVGNSMGGHIVQLLAYKYPELTRSAVISNSSAKVSRRAQLPIEARLPLFALPIAPADMIRSVLSQLYSIDFLEREDIVENLVTIMLANPFPMTELGYRSQMNALLQFDSRDWLKKITRPVLVIYSDDDPIVDLDSSSFLATHIPNAESYCFKRVGHLPHIEKPELFHSVVSEFLAKH